jgi:hypothetical protein
VDIRWLLMSLKAIECVCAQDKSNAQSNKKASNRGKKGNKTPGTESTNRVPKKAHTEKHATSARNMGAHIPCTTPRIVVGTKKAEWKQPISAPPRKAERNPITQSTLSRDWARIGLGATKARGVGRERRGDLRGGCMSKLCVE